MMLTNADTELIRRYDISGPRYTSYPTAMQFSEDFTAADYRSHAEASNGDLIPKPLSVYFHIPFCQSLCYYCACNKKVTQHPEQAIPYLQALQREIQLHAALYDQDRKVRQIHFGGGSPTFISDQQISELLQALEMSFPMDRSEGFELSIEVDPRTVDPERIDSLARIGFNRLSFGIQDFNPQVQAAINRKHSLDMVKPLVERARDRGFQSISFDLIYGLPMQTEESFATTLAQAIELQPDRLSLYNYAHLPHRFKAQRLIDEDALPAAISKLHILVQSINFLCHHGYSYVGMDHFALPDNELFKARKNGTLQRNFQGYSTMADCDLIGLGMSAISQVGDCFSQNHKHIITYQDQIMSGKLAVAKGYACSSEDRVRRYLIQRLMCYGDVDFKQISRRFGISSEAYFAGEIRSLRAMEKDGLVQRSPHGFRVTDKGWLLLRNIAMVFDTYLQQSNGGYSRVI